MKISLVMIVKNESDNIGACLDSAIPLVDEVIVVDTGSNDNTKEVAVNKGAIAFDFKWCDDFSKARNFALSKASGDWNLILDADEIISVGSRATLETFIKKNSDCVGSILIKSSFKENGETCYSQSYIPRFAHKDIVFTGKIHEQLGEGVSRKALDVSVDHSGYFENDKSKRNLNLLYKSLEKKPNDTYLLYQTAKTLFVSEDYNKAMPYYKKGYKKINIKQGYAKDFIVSYLYNLTHSKDISLGLNVIDEWKGSFGLDVDFNFACGIYYMNLVMSNASKYISYLSLIEPSYLKCLEIGESSFTSVVGVGSYKAQHNLAVYYEVTGDKDKAKHFYNQASKSGYKPSTLRLSSLI